MGKGKGEYESGKCGMKHSEFYKRAIVHLDALVMFMGLRDERFFRELQDNWVDLVGPGEQLAFPTLQGGYEQLILGSALLLGVTYVEAYLGDVLREVFRRKPQILATREKTIPWEKLVRARSYKRVLGIIIDAELSEFTRLAIDRMVGYFERRFKLEAPDQESMNMVTEASLVRNVIAHNGAVVGAELARHNVRFREGGQLRLEVSQIHEYGLAGRSVLQRLDEQLMNKYLSD